MRMRVTEDEERCYRLRHHDFAGCTVEETAEEMRITQNRVRLLLKSLRAKAPYLFPILTHRQHVVYWLYVEKGMPMYKIAILLNAAYSTVWGLLSRIRQKGMPFPKISGFGDMISYGSKMDNFIIHKF